MKENNQITTANQIDLARRRFIDTSKIQTIILSILSYQLIINLVGLVGLIIHSYAQITIYLYNSKLWDMLDTGSTIMQVVYYLSILSILIVPVALVSMGSLANNLTRIKRAKKSFTEQLLLILIVPSILSYIIHTFAVSLIYYAVGDLGFTIFWKLFVIITFSISYFLTFLYFNLINFNFKKNSKILTSRKLNTITIPALSVFSLLISSSPFALFNSAGALLINSDFNVTNELRELSNVSTTEIYIDSGNYSND